MSNIGNYDTLVGNQLIIDYTDNTINYYIDDSSGEIALAFKNKITGAIEFLTTHGYKIKNLSNESLMNIQQQIANYGNNINEQQLKEIYKAELSITHGTQESTICPCCQRQGIIVNDILNCTYINCSGWNHRATYVSKLNILFPSLGITDEFINKIVHLLYKTTPEQLSHIREIDINMILLVLLDKNNGILNHTTEQSMEELKYLNHITAMKLGKIPNGLSDQIHELINCISIFNSPVDLLNLSSIDFTTMRGAEYYIKNFVENNSLILPLLNYHKSASTNKFI